MKEPEAFFSSFLREIQKEINYLEKGGTSYRKVSAELSLKVAIQVGEVFPFLNRELAISTISKLYPNLDFNRKNDVAKMMYVIARDLQFNATLPEEIKKYVHQKRQNRNTHPLKFKDK